MTKTPRFALALVLLAALVLAGAAAAADADNLDRLLAPSSACPNQTDLGDSAPVQQQAMLCMTNFARAHNGLAAFNSVRALNVAAGHKSADIIRCAEFSHEACGRPFTYWMRRSGYLRGSCWSAAENIAWGTGPLGTVRGIFRAWLHSSGHRENILGPYRDIGIGLRVGRVEGHAGGRVWTQEFGTRGC